MKYLIKISLISFILCSCSQYTMLTPKEDDVARARNFDTSITITSLNNGKLLVTKYYKTNFKKRRIFAVSNNKLQTKVNDLAVKHNLSDNDKNNIIKYIKTMREKQWQANSQDKDISLSIGL